MTGYVVVVDFQIRDGCMDGFLPAMTENAATSLRDEPGCSVFDVCQDPRQPNRVYLYEVYQDRVAFDAHLASPHFQRFNEVSGPWIIEKNVETFQRVPASEDGGN
ncbi:MULTISPECIES: putative quinol monooxygenase [unclassified Ensifer]|uniref:putative quinol monooxygenase n=1 Tax=unclassified Ensifer TaxID=2633371 RepID=UPI000713E5B3|nr:MULTISPECIES: putative quinol monooxygenase [unclassified Ensifer]KQX51327.1 antibiotic biosynthesis monooxygenase [Ensifer sp. Root1298]KQX83692.1 antibiotic biosynthesis monooxygenase [Ensifer sp. Root1312]KRC20037.1 antibiotic biosynthesis monooxygenase [Ensifer sp. Root74]KRD63284.1 antibiotic biosynthesis monooxygenase [Ensifer sp. Root954]